MNRVLMKLAAALLLALIGTAAQAQVMCGDPVMSWDLNFGVHTTSVNDVTSGELRLRCKNESAETRKVTLCVELGAGSGGTVGAWRRLTDGSNDLLFQIYRDAERSHVLSTGDNGAAYASMTIPGQSTEDFFTDIRLYGRIPAGQIPAATGVYQSTFVLNNDVRIRYADYQEYSGMPICSLMPNVVSGSSSFAAYMKVVPECKVDIKPHIDFGSHTALTSDLKATGTLRVQCTADTGYRIALNDGSFPAGYLGRHMRRQGGSELIHYRLFQDEGLSQPWGSQGGDKLQDTGTGEVKMHPVYGLVPPQTVTAAGQYRDRVVVTVEY